MRDVIQTSGDTIEKEIMAMPSRKHLICFAPKCQKRATTHTVQVAVFTDHTKVWKPYVLAAVFCDDKTCKKYVKEYLPKAMTAQVDKNSVNVCDLGHIKE